MTKRSIILFIISIASISCNSTKIASEKDNNKIYYIEVVGAIKDIENNEIPDKYARYPGGIKGIQNLIINEIYIPPEVKQNWIRGKVIVEFYVGVDGNVEDVNVIKNAHPLLEEIAIDVIQKMEKWKPGEKDGELVRVRYAMPFNF